MHKIGIIKIVTQKRESEEKFKMIINENHQKISSVRRENKYIYMYIYTHFQTVAILKKNLYAFCFLIYNIYIYINP